MRHAAEEASHHINFVMCGDTLKDSSPTDLFYEITIRECLGFLGTKVMDHNRKPLGSSEIQRVLEDLDSGLTHPFHAETRESLLATQRFLDQEKSGESKLFLPKDASEEVVSGTAHLIGYLLGNWIYEALMSGKLSRKEVRGLFSESLADSGSGERLFCHWLRKVADQA